MERKRYARKMLDLDIGCLVKSPCRECWEYYRFPACTAECRTLHRVQSLLACSVLTTRKISPREAYSILLDMPHKK